MGKERIIQQHTHTHTPHTCLLSEHLNRGKTPFLLCPQQPIHTYHKGTEQHDNLHFYTFKSCTSSAWTDSFFFYFFFPAGYEFSFRRLSLHHHGEGGMRVRLKDQRALAQTNCTSELTFLFFSLCPSVSSVLPPDHQGVSPQDAGAESRSHCNGCQLSGFIQHSWSGG